MTQLAKISSKGQVTVPVDIRKALGVDAGDMLAFDLQTNGQVVVRRAGPLDLDYLTAVGGTLSEWNSAEDDEAYGDL